MTIKKENQKLKELLKFIIEEEKMALIEIKFNENGSITKITLSNEIKKMLGFNENEDIESFETWLDLIEEENKINVIKEMTNSLEYKKINKTEYKCKTKNNEIKYHKLIFNPEINEENKIEKILCIIKDITKEKELIESAYIDKLTKLKNRNEYEKDIEEIKKSGYIPENLTYITYDVNRLKYINDTFGHEKGDELIINCSNILKEVYQGKGKIYRIGGDEFVIIGIIKNEEILELTQKVKELCNKYNENKTEDISMSFGFINEKSIEDVSIEKLRKISDQLMYNNKNEYYEKTGLNRRKN